MATPNDYEGRADSDQHLRDSIEAAWDAGESLATEQEISRDVVASEIYRRDPSDRELFEAAYDAGVMRAEARERAEDWPEREARPDYADSADKRGIRKSLEDAADAAEERDKPAEAKADAKPAETEPAAEDRKAEPETPADALDGYTAEDRAVLSRMSAEDARYLEGRVAEAVAGPTAYTARDMEVLARLSPADREHVMRRVAEVAAPAPKSATMADLSPDPDPAMSGQPHIAPHPLQAAALASPQAAPQAAPSDPNDLRGKLESDW